MAAAPRHDLPSLRTHCCSHLASVDVDDLKRVTIAESVLFVVWSEASLKGPHGVSSSSDGICCAVLELDDI